MTSNRLPWDITATAAGDEKAVAAAAAQVVRRLIVVLLLTAAALDLTRCGLVLTAERHPSPTAGLVAAGLAATGLTARTARGCQVGQRWAGWAALLIGAASAPQAVASGFRSPYTIPDAATAAVGLLLAITILATAGRMGRPDTTRQFPVCRTGRPRGVPPGRTRRSTSWPDGSSATKYPISYSTISGRRQPAPAEKARASAGAADVSRASRRRRTSGSPLLPRKNPS
jgi:hypothetical protein